MLTVHVLAMPGIMGATSTVLAGDPDISIELRTNNLREALSFRYSSQEEVLIVDDSLLAANPSLIASISELPCKKILVGRLADADTARRALALEAHNIVDEVQLAAELPDVLQSLRTPQAMPTEAQVISVYSAKGGVGKSTVALNLAWALALQSDLPVALVDCDPLGDIGAMIQDKPGATVVDVMHGLAHGMSDEKALQSLYAVKGIGLTIVPAPLNPQETDDVSAPALESLLNLIKSVHAYVVLDLPTGLTDLNLTAMDASSRILVLAAPERVTLGTIGRSLDVLARFYDEKLAVVLNRADSDTGLDLPEVSQMLHREIRHVLPSGGSAPVRAANRGRPLVLAEPKNPLAKALIALARDIVSEREGSRRRTRRWLVSRSLHAGL